jgi:hypothetical protein
MLLFLFGCFFGCVYVLGCFLGFVGCSCCGVVWFYRGTKNGKIISEHFRRERVVLWPLCICVVLLDGSVYSHSKFINT